MTIDPFIRISAFIAKLSERQYCWRVFEDFHSQEKSNSLTYTIASSCVCTSPLAVMTIGGLHDFVKVSISASFKSFLLIICIDAPESTTNSRSSSLRFDAGEAFSTSSSRLSSSPTTATSSDSETREGEDRKENDPSPVPVSSFNVDDRTGTPVVCRESNHEQGRQANQKLTKNNSKETMIDRGHPLFADSDRASSEIPEWLQEFREKLVDDEVPEQRLTRQFFS